ncbi:macrophage mannose receptor 1-like [Anneissia japonica]|uniref:macrophage mannose receptor 1-like n=1 Tax=Anneissia japonica TaxID=1529436 RepID=UPI001425A9CB|nr:macrophage mannose receptor 1-like [Anneissia japonica]
MLYNMDTNGWADNVCDVKRNWICKLRKGSDGNTPLPTVTGIQSPGCGDGWLLFPSNNQCYKFYGDSQRQTWSDAESVCLREDANIVSIHSFDEMNFIRSIAAKLPTYQVWIGMREYYGALGYVNSDRTVANYFRWDINQPNNMNNNEQCIHMTTTEGKMAHETCVETRAFVCKKRSNDAITTAVAPTTVMPGYCPSGWWTRGNKCYNFFQEKKNWTNAKSFCESNGGGLVSVNDQYDQAYLITLLQDIDYSVWIGVNDRGSDGMFVNADGSDITFAAWMPGEPNGGKNENCVEIYSGASVVPGAWNDLPCNLELGFMCQQPRDDTATPTKGSNTKCPDGFVIYRDACYKVMTTNNDFNAAEKKCVDARGHLSSVSDVFEQKQLELMSQDVGAVPLWIGLSYQESSGKYTWTDGWPTTFTHWAYGQPIKNDENGGCVIMLPTGQWNDTSCLNKYNSVCKITDAKPPVYPSTVPGNCTDETWTSFGAYCYKAFVTEQVSWHTAQYTCSKMRNTNLVSIHDSKELNFINNVVIPRESSTVWIGLIADEASGFSWTDGTAVDYLPWAPGEPSGKYEDETEDCVQLYHNSGKWNDLSCSNQLPYICKYSKYDEPVISTDDTFVADEGLGVGAIVGIVLGSIGFLVAIFAVVMLVKKQRRLLEYFRHSVNDGLEEKIYD